MIRVLLISAVLLAGCGESVVTVTPEPPANASALLHELMKIMWYDNVDDMLREAEKSHKIPYICAHCGLAGRREYTGSVAYCGNCGKWAVWDCFMLTSAPLCKR